MILTCNKCGIGFNFDETLLKETGSKVRCSKCKNVFTAYPTSSQGQSEMTDFATKDEPPFAPDTEPSLQTPDEDGIDLKNVDLEEIEGILGMDNEPDSAETSSEGSGELGFDFTAEEDKEEATLESTLESEKTEELDLAQMDNILKEDEISEETLSLDLSDMENILEVKDEPAEETESSQEEGLDLELDLDIDENEGETSLESTLESEKTEEIDLSDMENILEVKDEPAEETESSQQEDLDFELDLDIDENEGETKLESTLESEKTEDLDLAEMDSIPEEDEEPEPESDPSEDTLALDLDFDIDEISDQGSPDFEPDETVALNLSDMDNILDVEDEPAKESESSEEDDFDFELDFGSDQDEVVSDSEPEVDLEKTEDLDLSDFENILDEDKPPETESESTDDTLGLDLDIDEISDQDGSDSELEETVEMDLSDSDTSLEIEDEESKSAEPAADDDLDFELDLDFEDEKESDDKTPKSTVAEAEAPDELDFELDLDMDEAESINDAELELKPESEAIEELDLPDMEDGTGTIDQQVAEDVYDEKTDELDFDLDMVTEEGEDTDNDSLAVELGDAEEFDLSDLESALGENDKEIEEDASAEELEELELDLDMVDEVTDVPDDNASEIQLESTEKFDLSDIDSMIDTDEKTKPQDEEPEEVELDFEIDGSAQDLLVEDETIEEQLVSPQKEKLDDTFDMGAVEYESEAEDVEAFTDSKKAKPYATRKKPAGKKRLSAPMRILLILVLLVGGAYGAQQILNSMGIKISVTDAIREIPLVGDLLQPDVKDIGNLSMNIFERSVNGKFVENPKIGTLFVVTGKIKNEYKHSRRHIRMTGKLYKQGKALVKTETVYCGNLLSETELKSLNQTAIIKRLKNRLGDKRINLNVKSGQVLPFMIVFSNLPSGLEEYSVQVAGSGKS